MNSAESRPDINCTVRTTPTSECELQCGPWPGTKARHLAVASSARLLYEGTTAWSHEFMSPQAPKIARRSATATPSSEAPPEQNYEFARKSIYAGACLPH